MTGSNEKIWFDGVNKKLIEAHSGRPTLKNCDEKNLKTMTPLSTISVSKKIKRLKHETKRKDKSKHHEQRGTNSKVTKKTKETPPDSTIIPSTGITDELAIDCEMVECYHNTSVLARVSIVNLFGHPILDRYVAPPSKVTDYRTKWSGIRRRDLVDAPDFETVQKEVADLIRGRIVVGHSIRNDFSVLKLDHPPNLIRDTSVYYKYLFQGKTPSLRKLSESLLGIKIQSGEHDSVQDAQATMKLYVKERDKWNDMVAKGDNKLPPMKSFKSNKQKKKPLKKKIKTFFTMT